MPETYQLASIHRCQSPIIFKPPAMIQAQDDVDEQRLLGEMTCGDNWFQSMDPGNPLQFQDSASIVVPSPCNRNEIENRLDKSFEHDDMRCDWSTNGHAEIESSVLPDGSGSGSLYSFYFENSDPCEQCDDLSITSHETSDYGDKEMVLLDMPENPANFWDCPNSNKRQHSPAQVSLESDPERTSRQHDTMNNATLDFSCHI